MRDLFFERLFTDTVVTVVPMVDDEGGEHLLVDHPGEDGALTVWHPDEIWTSAGLKDLRLDRRWLDAPLVARLRERLQGVNGSVRVLGDPA